MVIKGASGFGDSVYLNPIVKYFVDKNTSPVTVVTKYPEIFKSLNCQTIEQTQEVNIHCSYVPRKSIKSTNQFEDMCIQAQIPFMPLQLHLDLEVSDHVKDLVNRAKPYVAFVEPYKENIRSDYSLKPNNEFMEKLVLGILCDKQYNVIKINSFYGYTTHEVIYIIKNSEQSVGQVGYVIPVSEAFDVPCIAVFSENYKKSTNHFVKTIAARKVISKVTTKCVYDNE